MMNLQPSRQSPLGSKKIQPIQLLVLDVDGTVTNSQHKVTEATISAIHRVRAAGIRVLLAGGQPPAAPPEHRPESALTTPRRTVPPAEAVPSLSDCFQELLGQLAVLRSQLTSVTGQVRALQKRSERELKNAQKAGRKRARKTGNRAPSGFVKPTKISKELAKFL